MVPRGKLGYDVVTTKASVNLMESSDAGLCLEVIPSGGKVDRTLCPCKLVFGCRQAQQRGVTMGEEAHLSKGN